MPLLKWTNDTLHVVPPFPLPSARHPISPDVALPVRDALWAHEGLLERFVAENPARLPGEALALAASWKHRVSGVFFVYKHYKKHSIFLHDTQGVLAVLGIFDPLEAMLPATPALAKTVLIPFRDVIIYDSLLIAYPIGFGPGIRRSVKARYDEARALGTIRRSLP